VTTKTALKVQRELISLYALAIMNIAFGGIAMALAISIGVQNILALVKAQSLLPPQLTFGILGFLAFGVSLRWLISSTEILDGATDIKDDYEKKKANLADEDLTGLIVQMMAYYRRNKPTIKKMMVVSKIAGVCFLIGGGFNLTTVLTSIVSGAPQWDILLQALAATINFVVGAVSLFLTHFFGKYCSAWDYRLEETSKAEKELEKQLEGS